MVCHIFINYIWTWAQYFLQMHVRPAKTQINLLIRTVWSVSAEHCVGSRVSCVQKRLISLRGCWAHMHSCRTRCASAHMKWALLNKYAVSSFKGIGYLWYISSFFFWIMETTFIQFITPFVTSCLPFCTPNHFWKKNALSNALSKERICYQVVDATLEGRQQFWQLSPVKAYPIPLNLL